MRRNVLSKRDIRAEKQLSLIDRPPSRWQEKGDKHQWDEEGNHKPTCKYCRKWEKESKLSKRDIKASPGAFTEGGISPMGGGGGGSSGYSQGNQASPLYQGAPPDGGGSTAGRPVPCPACNRKFENGALLEDHLRNQHGVAV